jgi:hypothetical protein
MEHPWNKLPAALEHFGNRSWHQSGHVIAATLAVSAVGS